VSYTGALCNKRTYFTQNTLIFLLMSADFDLCCHGTDVSLLQNTDSGSGTGLNCYLTLRRLMSYIYGAPILDVSRSHTTTQHSR